MKAVLTLLAHLAVGCFFILLGGCMSFEVGFCTPPPPPVFVTEFYPQQRSWPVQVTAPQTYAIPPGYDRAPRVTFSVSPPPSQPAIYVRRSASPLVPLAVSEYQSRAVPVTAPQTHATVPGSIQEPGIRFPPSPSPQPTVYAPPLQARMDQAIPGKHMPYRKTRADDAWEKFHQSNLDELDTLNAPGSSPARPPQ